MKKFLSTISILCIYAAISAFPASAAVNTTAITAVEQTQRVSLKTDGAVSKYAVKWNEKHNRLLGLFVKCWGEILISPHFKFSEFLYLFCSM